MSTEQDKTEEHIQELSSLLGLPRRKSEYPKENPFKGQSAFCKKVWDYMSEVCQGSEISPSVFQAMIEDTLPLVEYLIRPREISEYQEVKRGTMELLYHCGQGKSPDIFSRSWWLYMIADEIKMFPDEDCIIRELSKREITPAKAWEETEGTLIKTTDHNLKIVDYETALKTMKGSQPEVGGFAIRRGITIGKYRLQKHSEHEETIHQGKLELGTGGLFVCLVESKEGLQSVFGKNYYCEEDKERLFRMAQTSADLVSLVDHRCISEEERNAFFEKVWEEMLPDRYYVGSKDDALTPIFRERAQRLGVILLWARDSNKISNTGVIREVQGFT